MKRLLAVVLLVISLGAPSVLPAGAAPETPAKVAHTSGQVWNVCVVLDVGVWGPEPNGVAIVKTRPLHGYGLHIAACCYDNWGDFTNLEYVFGFGTWGQVHNEWCDPFPGGT